MAEKTTNYQCPACTGPLRFDSATGKLVCDYCGSTYEVKEVEALYADKQKASDTAARQRPQGPVWGEEEAAGLTSRTCSSCGAELVCDETTAATTCPYCGNPTVLGGKLSGKLKPEYILPFKLDKKAAIAQLTRYYKGKAFLPKAFKSQNHLAEIQGVYVPFWLYDAKADARGRYEGQNSESHREGDYMVTTTQHYDVRREGSAAFAKVPVDGSSKMPNTHMDAIEPFDYGDLKPFSTAYLPGYLADQYDVTVDDSRARADRRSRETLENALRETVTGYGTCVTDRTDIRLHRGKVLPSYPECALAGDAELREEILDERAREFAFEEIRWFDIVRWKRADIFQQTLYGIRVTILDGTDSSNFRFNFSEPIPETDRAWKNSFDPKWYLSAFPSNEVNKGYGLTQNAGW